MKLNMKTKMKKNMQAYVSSDEANIDKLWAGRGFQKV